MAIEFEEQIFKRKRIDYKKLAKYGFSLSGTSYKAEKEILDGEFLVKLEVEKNGDFKGEVYETETGEVFLQLKNPRYTGNFVGKVREAYEMILLDIARECAYDVSFQGDQANRITALIKEEYGVDPDFPWDNERYKSAGVFRHQDSGKWFALVMDVKRGLVEKTSGKSSPKHADETIDVMNVKINEEDGPSLCKRQGIYPAYHMSHKNWISIELDEKLPDKDIMALIAKSYDLTLSKGKKMDESLIEKVLTLADSVPEGKVTTYGQLAKLVGMEKNSRLVGKIMSMADRYGEHPCHRVVNSAGRTVPGWAEQRKLLEAEGVEFKNSGLVDMKKYLWDPKEMK